MKRLALQVFSLCFLTLIVLCAFDGTGVGHSLPLHSHDGGSFCVIIHTSTALTNPPSQPAPLVYSDEGVQPPSDTHTTWSLIRAIDHPPRVSERAL